MEASILLGVYEIHDEHGDPIDCDGPEKVLVTLEQKGLLHLMKLCSTVRSHKLTHAEKRIADVPGLHVSWRDASGSTVHEFCNDNDGWVEILPDGTADEVRFRLYVKMCEGVDIDVCSDELKLDTVKFRAKKGKS
jgi:hypothetical protein